MPEYKNFAQVRGSVIRVTRLSACGDPIPGANVVTVSKRISSISFEEVTEEGTNIRERNFGDEMMIVDDAYTDLLGVSAEVALMGVDPAVITLMTGQPVVLNAAGDTVGFDVTTGIDLDSFGFAIEIWSRIAGAACDPSGNRQWGYTLVPFLKGGRMGGFTFENGPVSFTITGAQTRDGNGWGVGPHDVDRDAQGQPSPLFTPVPTDLTYRNILVSLDPPVAQAGTFPLAL